MTRRATLIVLSGLPGTGKTTLCRLLAREISATYLRIDTIEDAVAGAGDDVGALGYVVAYAIALDNLEAGHTVIADSVNAIEITRSAWLAVAGEAGAKVLEVELYCSDPAEHRRRVEARLASGRSGPTWADVVLRDWEPFTRSVHRIDTAGRTAEDCLWDLMALIPL